MRSSLRTIVLWVVLITLFVAFYQVFQHGGVEPTVVSAADLDQRVAAGQVERIDAVFENDVARVRAEDTAGNLLRAEVDLRRLGHYQEQGVIVSTRPPDDGLWGRIVSQWLPVIFLFGFFIFFMRRVSGGQKVPPFKPVPQVLPPPGALTGLDDVRATLSAAARAALQGQPGPRRVLISGPPGTGKTTLVKAVAADSGLKVLSVPASELVELFIGTGARRVRDLFELAGKAQPVLVVIEDLDIVAKTRAANTPEKQQDEREQTLIELCQWLDGLKTMPDRVMFLATTSRPDLFDPAILRPGRFQLHVQTKV